MGTGVNVGVGIDVAVEVGLGVGVGFVAMMVVGVGFTPSIGVGVGSEDGVGVGTEVGVGVGSEDGVGVGTEVGVGLGRAVGVGVPLRIEVGTGTGSAVGDSHGRGVAKEVPIATAVTVGFMFVDVVGLTLLTVSEGSIPSRVAATIGVLVSSPVIAWPGTDDIGSTAVGSSSAPPALQAAAAINSRVDTKSGTKPRIVEERYIARLCRIHEMKSRCREVPVGIFNSFQKIRWPLNFRFQYFLSCQPCSGSHHTGIGSA